MFMLMHLPLSFLYVTPDGQDAVFGDKINVSPYIVHVHVAQESSNYSQNRDVTNTWHKSV